MKDRAAHKILPAILIAAGLALAATLNWYISGRYAADSARFADQDLAVQGKRLRGFALGTEGLLADWYWMASLQYLGDKIVSTNSGELNIEDLRPLDPRLLYPYLDNATDLDPKFLAAHYYGAVVLPAIDPQKAIALTEKGIANNPGEWRLYQYLGYIYWRLKDYDKAAETYEKGSTIENVPPFMKMMAAAMRNQGGGRETARLIYAQMETEATDQSTRDNARLRLMELDSLDERDAIAGAITAFRERSGRCPLSMFELFPFLRAARLPQGKSLRIDAAGAIVDPAGVPYVLDANRCTVRLGADSPLPKS